MAEKVADVIDIRRSEQRKEQPEWSFPLLGVNLGIKARIRNTVREVEKVFQRIETPMAIIVFPMRDDDPQELLAEVQRMINITVNPHMKGLVFEVARKSEIAHDYTNEPYKKPKKIPGKISRDELSHIQKRTGGKIFLPVRKHDSQKTVEGGEHALIDVMRKSGVMPIEGRVLR